MHFDLTSTSLADQQQTVTRVLELGGRHLDIGQSPDDAHVVLADPEGNEFDVIEPGNNFLADCGFIGALSSDGTQEVGYFWSEALGLAVGLGPGPGDRDPLATRRSEDHLGRSAADARTGENRLHYDLAPAEGSDQQSEIVRLVSLGATRVDIGQGDVDWVVMADPDGNAFCVFPHVALTRRPRRPSR